MFRIVSLVKKIRSGRPSFGAVLILALTANGLVSVAGSVTPAHGYNQEVERLNRFVQTSDSSVAELRIFREGRDLISDEQWGEAAGKFADYMKKYPKGKDVDAATYWMAYALVKQEKFQEADRALSRLISEFPNSRWRDDAKALQLQLPNKQPDQDIDSYSEETRIVALQSLFQGNPDQGASMAADILRDPKRSKRLKETAITLIGQHQSRAGMELLMNIARNETDTKLRKTAIFWMGQGGNESALDMLKEFTTSSTDAEVGKAAVFAISQNGSPRAMQMLAEMARSAASGKLREEAIFWLGQRGGPSVDDELIKIFESDPDARIRKKIIFTLSQRGSGAARAKLSEIARSNADKSARMEAIFWLGQRGGDEASADELLRIYDADTDAEIRKKVIFSLSQMRNDRARQKLFDIARGSDSPSARSEAIFWIGQTGGARGADYLIQLYDAEKSPEVKKKIIFSISQNHSKQGIRKLMEIAKSDALVELRKEAVTWLGQSGDPDAAKFLEEIVK
ncbi:MAG TPA: HEAT repeat domain-containing protein [Blastocatellia bacterium]|jgi:HEAT repeat protein